jgi:hypothetical protein
MRHYIFGASITNWTHIPFPMTCSFLWTSHQFTFVVNSLTCCGLLSLQTDLFVITFFDLWRSCLRTSRQCVQPFNDMLRFVSVFFNRASCANTRFIVFRVCHSNYLLIRFVRRSNFFFCCRVLMPWKSRMCQLVVMLSNGLERNMMECKEPFFISLGSVFRGKDQIA